MSKIYVNSAWTAESALPDGLIWGETAFASFDEAVQSLADNDTEIALLSDSSLSVVSTHKLNVVSGDGNNYNLGVNAEISVDAVFAKEINLDAGLFCAYYNNHNVVVNGNLNGGFYNYIGTLTFNNTKFTNCYENSNIGGIVNINGDGTWTVDNPQAGNLMFINIGRNDWLGQGILNLNDSVVKAITFSVDSNSADAKSQINAVNSTICTVLNDGIHGNFNVGANGEVNLTNSDLIVVGTMTNNGTVSVSGESSLNIAKLTGSSNIVFNDGAIIKDTTINGVISIDGSVEFKGDNTIVNGNALSVTDGSGDKMIVGKDATLKISRYAFGAGETVDIDGNIVDAKATDKANVDASFTVVAGMSINTGAGYKSTFTADNAYVVFEGTTSSKTDQSGGQIDMDITNSIVDAAAFKIQSNNGSNKSEYDVDFKNSVFNITSNFSNGAAGSVMTFDNSDVNAGANFRNDGTFELLNGSQMVVKSNGDGPGFENTGNRGEIVIAGSEDAISSLNMTAGTAAAANALRNSGSITVEEGGEFTAGQVINTALHTFSGIEAAATARSVKVVLYNDDNSIAFEKSGVSIAKNATTAFAELGVKEGTYRYEIILGEDVLSSGTTDIVNGSLNVMGGSVELDTLTNYGTITLSEAGLLDANSINGADGNVVINVTDGWKGVSTVIDIDNESSFGSISVDEADAADGVKAKVDENGDLIVYNIDGGTVYVDSAWATGYTFGQEIGEGSGKYFGINAFDNFEAVKDVFAQDGSETVINLGSDIEIKDKVIDLTGLITGDIKFTSDKAVTISQTILGSDFGYTEAKDITITIDENVTFEVYDNASGWYQYYGSSLDLYGTITGGQNWGCVYLFNGEHTIRETGAVNVARFHLGYTEVTVNGSVDTKYLLAEASTFTADGATVDAGVIHDSNNGGARWGASKFYFNDSEVTAGAITLKYADSVFEVSGTEMDVTGKVDTACKIVVDSDSKLSAQSFTFGENGGIVINMVNGLEFGDSTGVIIDVAEKGGIAEADLSKITIRVDKADFIGYKAAFDDNGDIFVTNTTETVTTADQLKEKLATANCLYVDTKITVDSDLATLIEANYNKLVFGAAGLLLWNSTEAPAWLTDYKYADNILLAPESAVIDPGTEENSVEINFNDGATGIVENITDANLDPAESGVAAEKLVVNSTGNGEIRSNITLTSANIELNNNDDSSEELKITGEITTGGDVVINNKNSIVGAEGEAVLNGGSNEHGAKVTASNVTLNNDGHANIDFTATGTEEESGIITIVNNSKKTLEGSAEGKIVRVIASEDNDGHVANFTATASNYTEIADQSVENSDFVGNLVITGNTEFVGEEASTHTKNHPETGKGTMKVFNGATMTVEKGATFNTDTAFLHVGAETYNTPIIEGLVPSGSGALVVKGTLNATSTKINANLNSSVSVEEGGVLNMSQFQAGKGRPSGTEVGENDKAGTFKVSGGSTANVIQFTLDPDAVAEITGEGSLLKIDNGSKSSHAFIKNAGEIKVSDGAAIVYDLTSPGSNNRQNDDGITNAGVIEVSGGTLNIVSTTGIANSGTLQVVGDKASSIDAKVTGNAIQLAGGILNDSDIDGNIQVTGESAISGDVNLADKAIVKVSGGKLTIEENASLVGPAHNGLPKNFGISLVAGQTNESWIEKDGLSNQGAGTVEVAGEVFAGQVHATADGKITVAATGSVTASEMSAGVSKMESGKAGIIDIYGDVVGQKISANAGGTINVYDGASLSTVVLNNEDRRITVGADSTMNVYGGSVVVDIANKTNGGRSTLDVNGTMNVSGGEVIVDRVTDPADPAWVTNTSNYGLNVGATGTLDISGGSVEAIKVANEGTIKVSGGTLDADTLTNNKDVNVTGGTLEIGTLSGSGTVNVSGSAEFNIDTQKQQIYVNKESSDKVTISGDIKNSTSDIIVYDNVTVSNLKYNSAFDDDNVKAPGRFILKGDVAVTGNSEITAGGVQIQNSGVIEVGSVVKANTVNVWDYTASNGDAIFKVQGRLEAVSFIVLNDYYYPGNDNFIIDAGGVLRGETQDWGGSHGLFGIQNGNVTVYGYVDGNWALGGADTGCYINVEGCKSTLTVDGTFAADDNDNGKFVNVGDQVLNVNEGGTLNIINGGLVDWATDINNYGTISVTGGTLNVGDELNNNEGAVINLTEKSVVNVEGTFTNAGTIKVDVTDGWKGSKVLIDAAVGANAEDFGTIEVDAADAADGLKVKFDEATGDLIAYNIDTKTVYVDSNWETGYIFGQEVVADSGKFYNVNAFGHAADAIRDAALNANIGKIEVDENTSTELYAFAVNNNITTENKNGLVVDLGNHGVSVDKDMNTVVNGEINNDYEGAESTIIANGITIDENVKVIADTIFGHGSAYEMNINGEVEVNGAYLRKDGDVEVAGKLTVKDTLSLIADEQTPSLTVTEDGELKAANVFADVNSEITVNGTANITNIESDGSVNIGASGTLNLTGNADIVELDNDGTFNAGAESTFGTVDNSGIINITDGKTFTAPEVANSGKINVSGTVTVDAVVTGNAVSVNYGAVINDSSLSADLAVAGAATIKYSNINGNVTGNAVITIEGENNIVLGDDSQVNCFYVKNDVTLNPFEVAGVKVYSDLNSVAIYGDYVNSVLTLNASALNGNYVAGVALNIKDVNYGEAISVNTAITNISSINGFDVIDGLYGSYIFTDDNGTADDTADDVTYKLVQSGSEISFEKFGAADTNYETSSLIAFNDAALPNVNVEMTEGYAYAYIGYQADVEVGALKKSEKGGYTNVTVDQEGSLKVNGAIESINTLVTGYKAGLVAGDVTGTGYNDVIYIGALNENVTLSSINLKTGWDYMYVGYDSDVTVNGDVSGLSSLIVDYLGDVTITGNYIAGGYANTITAIGDVTIDGSISNADINVGTYIYVGWDAEFKSGDITYLSGVTFCGGNLVNGEAECSFTAGNVDGTTYDNLFYFGYASDVEFGNLNGRGGYDQVITDIFCDVKFDNISNVQLISTGWASDFESKNISDVMTFVFIGGASSTDKADLTVDGTISTTDYSDYIYIGNFTDATIGNINGKGGYDVIVTGYDTDVTVGNIDSVGYIGIGGGVSSTDKAEFTAASISGTEYNDTIVLGNFTDATIGNINGKGGYDVIVTGYDTDVTVGNIDNIGYIGIGGGVSSTDKAEFTAANISGTEYNDAIAFGNFVDASISGNIDLGAGYNTITTGYDTDVTAGDINGLASLWVNNGVSSENESEFTAGNITGTQYDDFIGGGAFTDLEFESITFGEGHDYLTTGYKGEVEVNNKIDFGAGYDNMVISDFSRVEAGSIDFGSEYDNLSIGYQSELVLGKNVENVEAIYAGFDSKIIVNDVDNDVNFDKVAGTWQNATIYDVEGVLNAGENALSGDVYGNEWDIYTFNVTGEENNDLTIIGANSSIQVDLHLYKMVDDEWTSIGTVHPLYDIESGKSGLENGQYAIAVKVDGSDFDKENNDNNKYSFTAKLA